MGRPDSFAKYIDNFFVYQHMQWILSIAGTFTNQLEIN